MKIKEIIQRVQSLYSKGVQSDDTRLSSRHIYSKVLTTRAKLLSQKLNKRQPISQWVYQTLDCVELVEALPYECPCLPAVGCKILRTKNKLPQPLLGMMNGNGIQSVTSLEGSITFSETTWKNKKYSAGSKYTSSKPDYYLRNDYLYVTTKGSPKVISITGLFDDPVEAEKFPSICGDTPCKEGSLTPADGCPECMGPLDKELPIDLSMVDTLIELASNELINVFNQSREDTSNNSMDSAVQETK
tara:strand:+ start:15 stop:749 length:735 start_codon:yes stop_codon:yes gene_type:complete